MPGYFVNTLIIKKLKKHFNYFKLDYTCKNTLLTQPYSTHYNYTNLCNSQKSIIQSGKSMSELPQVYRKYDLLFTPHLIPQLRSLRGEEWDNLIDHLSDLSETHPDTLAFSVMMINLGGCLSCEMDSYRAQRGCATCAKQTVISYKGSDQQLLKQYEKAQLFISGQVSEQPLKKVA